ncbi:peroxidase 2-like [Phragmites australis]|uniref:peroxidase 2-like n=1 Tax=Phragmites australis TaxID=29695 RepID=UPI002D764BB8|nr:peroxidase 2-like [Phragmites australis]
MANKLAALIAVIISLLGSVSCQASYGYGYGGYGGGNPTPPPPSSYPPTSPRPPTYPPTTPSPPAAGLRVGYYDDKCSGAEAIVREAVRGADAGVKAGLVRMFFHDCFVRGCDASVLLKPTEANPQPEMLGIPNLSLRGFEVIDKAKAALEKKCPGIVSCTDILAFAGRDASYFLSSYAIDFKMPAGRYDGNVSLASETLANLPPPFADVKQLKDMFAAKGLDTVDMVVLSGAHSIGRSHCSSFSGRLPPSNTSDMDPTLAAKLKGDCVSPNGADNTVMQDYKTPNELDNQYYLNVLNHKVLFASDAALLKATDTMRLVYAAAASQKLWQYKFGEAMVKMGGIEVKTAANGEIRKMCGFVNKAY